MFESKMENITSKREKYLPYKPIISELNEITSDSDDSCGNCWGIFGDCGNFMTNMIFYCLMVLTCTPLCLGYFVILDVIFAIYSVLFSCLYLVTLGRISIAHSADDYVFTKVLGLTRMELVGYRRLRTISQTTDHITGSYYIYN